MPEISRFLGSSSRCSFDDHTRNISCGVQWRCCSDRNSQLFRLLWALAARVLGFVIEWATIHQQELLVDWERAQAQQDMLKIAPLV